MHKLLGIVNLVADLKNRKVMKKFKIGDRVVAKDYPDFGIGTIVFIDWANVVKFDKDIDTYSYEVVSEYKSDKNDLQCFNDNELEIAP